VCNWCVWGHPGWMFGHSWELSMFNIRLCWQVVDALQLSRRTFRKIQQNLGWAFAYNIVALPLAAGALLPSCGLALTPSLSGMQILKDQCSSRSSACKVRCIIPF
jgi:hypothetical protein